MPPEITATKSALIATGTGHDFPCLSSSKAAQAHWGLIAARLELVPVLGRVS